MKIGPILGLTALLTALTACGGETTLQYSVHTNIADSGKSMEIFQASERVLTRWLSGADVKNAHVTVIPSDSEGALMTIKVPDAASADTAKRILMEPFTFDIRLEGPIKPENSPNETNWLETGIDGSVLLWVVAITNPDTKEVGVELMFNQNGRALLQEAFSGNKGKSVGIFVRDLLVSKMTISSEEVTDHILITGIPSERVAHIFADDVNVGLFAVFTPKK